MAYTGEYIILYDRLRDPDILNRLLKRNVYMDIEIAYLDVNWIYQYKFCLLYTSPSPRDRQKSRMPSSA